MNNIFYFLFYTKLQVIQSIGIVNKLVEQSRLSTEKENISKSILPASQPVEKIKLKTFSEIGKEATNSKDSEHNAAEALMSKLKNELKLTFAIDKKVKSVFQILIVTKLFLYRNP